MAKLIFKSLRALLCLLGAACAFGAQGKPPEKSDSCRECHAQLGGELGGPATKFQDDIHARSGLACTDCHGGNPREAEPDKAMNRGKGFRGAPKRGQIPELCGRCHADGAYMRTYNPKLRTDQLSQYWTSMHGKRLRAGDTLVAVCTDCHGAHGVLPASSPLSTVYPLQVPETCGRCHADAAYMKTYRIRTDQLESYRASVHYQTLKAGDLSAPTCPTCHGNHGATPPGVNSVERVCGTCHIFQQQLFDRGPHKAVWAAAGLPSCITCHGNHKIEHTGDALLGTGSGAFCIRCHVAGDAGSQAALRMHQALTELDGGVTSAEQLLDRAERLGMLVSDARLTLSGAREKLIKARVDVHNQDADSVQKTTGEGMKLVRQVEQAGQNALAEYAYRRKGLAISVIIIAFVVFSLVLLIRQLEQTPAPRATSSPAPGPGSPRP